MNTQEIHRNKSWQTVHRHYISHICIKMLSTNYIICHCASLLQIFPNADLRLLKECVSVRDKLLQKQYDEHKVQLIMI